MASTLAEARHWSDVDWAPSIREQAIDGRRVRYLDHGEGPAIVLLHGLGGAWQTWLNNIPALAARHRLIGVDLPGFGDSDVLPPPAEMATHAEVVAALLDALQIETATVVAHSMGGLVAFALVAQRPELVERLVLANAGGVPLSAWRLAMIVNSIKAFHLFFGRPWMVRALAQRTVLRRTLLPRVMGSAKPISGPFAMQIVPRITAPGFVGAVVAAARVAGTADRAAITCPTLVLWGARDPILPLDEARALAAELSDARLEVLEGAGHCPMFEVPDAFNRAVLAFTSQEERR